MANEYGELEQMVNDVTSLDTARMTLRWALERLNTIEKERADLKKGLTLAEETAKKLQAKEASLQDAYSSRNKTLEEKEDFYTKLEATMSLLGEGKLDIQQLLKKEAKLDGLRKSLETEYEEKFAELDRSQRSIVERWNSRLLDVEGQYAGRLAEAQKKYDSLRSELEAEHQARLTELQTSFRRKEVELSGRIAFLEGSVRESGEKVETRRREVEAEFMGRKRELEENFRKLRNMLETDLEEKLRAMDSDHAAQISSLEASWQAERSRLLEEQRVREAQFMAAQARIKEIENNLASQQESHHNELLRLISEKETAFRAQLAELEKEKGAKEAQVRELTEAISRRVAGWEKEKAEMQASFDKRAGELEFALRERETAFEKEHAARKEELARAAENRRKELEAELEERLADERRGMAAARARLEEDKTRLELSLGAASDKIKDLEKALAEVRESRQEELLEHINSSEGAFREKLAAMESAVREAEAGLKEREAAMERGYAARKEELAQAAAARQKELETELEERLADERRGMAAARARLEEDKTRLGDSLAAASGKIKELEKAISSVREDGRQELLAQISASEESFRQKLAAFEAERLAFNSAMEEMTAELRRRESASLEGQKELEAEFARRAALYEEKLSAMAAEASRRAEEHRTEISRVSFEAGNRAEERVAAAKAEFEKRAARIKEEAAASIEAFRTASGSALAAERDNWLSERGVFEKSLEEMTVKFRESQVEIVSLNASLRKAAEEAVAREAALTVEKVELKASFEKELSARLREAVQAQTASLVEAMEAMKEERTALKEALEKKAEEINALKDEFSRAKAELRAGLEAKHAAELDSERADSEKKTAIREEALRAEYRAARERLEAELRAKSEEISAEAVVRVEFERSNWAAERARLEEQLGTLSGEFGAAQRRMSGMTAEKEAEKAVLEKAHAAEIEELKADFAAKLAAAGSDSTVELAAERRIWAAEKERLQGSISEIASRLEDFQKSAMELSSENASLRSRIVESDSKINSAVVAARAGAEKAAEERLAAAVAAETAGLRKALNEKEGAHRADAAAAEREIAVLKANIDGLKRDVATMHTQVFRTENEAIAKSKEQQEFMLRLRQEHLIEVQSAAKAAAESVRAVAARELEAARKESEKKELEHARVMEAAAREAEKESIENSVRMAAVEAAAEERAAALEGENERAAARLAQAEEKILSLEAALASQKEEGAKAQVEKAAAHEAEVRAILAGFREKQAGGERAMKAELAGAVADYEKRISELGKLLRAKEDSVRGEREALAAKLSELWKLEAEVYARERQLRDEKIRSERDTEEKRLGMEREFHKKNAELENLRTELARTIAAYRSGR